MADRRPPRRRFGQNFLEPQWAAKVVAAIEPRSEDRFIEIGPGTGALTAALSERAGSVLAYEIDRDLAADLAAARLPRVRVVAADFLAADVQRHLAAVPPGPGPLRVAGNLPYNVASPILFKLAELYASGVPIVDATVMLQREVADRLLAPPGTKDYGVLTVLMKHTADAVRMLNLPPGAFRPAPKVRSTVVRLRFHPPAPPVRDVGVFRALVQAVFTRRRKTLANALDAYASGDETPRPTLSIDARRRPETLTVAEFAQLADAFSP
jgi:16S rRNA (adenine1518-N6/adenine1519-N6)-dimethyltransferase